MSLPGVPDVSVNYGKQVGLMSSSRILQLPVMVTRRPHRAPAHSAPNSDVNLLPDDAKVGRAFFR